MRSKIFNGVLGKPVIRTHYKVVIRPAQADALVYRVINSKIRLGNHRGDEVTASV